MLSGKADRSLHKILQQAKRKYYHAEAGLHFEITPWERLVKARLLDKFEKPLPVSVGMNGCDNLRSKHLFQEGWKYSSEESKQEQHL